jgi:uncharacterized protein YjdB
MDLKQIVPGAREIRSSVSYDSAARTLFLTDEAQQDGCCWAFGLDPATGRLTPKWHTQLGFSTSTPAVCNGRIYVGTGLYSIRGGVYCLDELTGSVIWKFIPDSQGVSSVPGVQASPVVSVQNSAPYIYFPTIWEHSSIFCLDQEGKQVWQYDDQDLAYVHQGVAAAGGWLYLDSNSGLCALRPAAPEPVTGISLDKTTDTIPIGATDTLTVEIAPAGASNRQVAWSSDNQAVATVVYSGTSCTVTGVSAGTAKITATTADGGFTADCAVIVQHAASAVPVTGIALDKTIDTIAIGATDILTAKIAPANSVNQQVAWSSDNQAVATVDAGGVVTGVSAGTAKITATTADGDFTADCAVTVGGQAITVQLTIRDQNNKVRFNQGVSVQQGQTVADVLLAAAKIDPAIDPVVDWDCIYVTGGYVESLYGEDSPFGEQADGWVYFVDGMEPNVGAAVFGKADYKLLNDGDQILWRWSWMEPVEAISLNQPTANIAVGQSETLSAIITPTDSTNADVTWTSNNPSVATVDSNGRVTVVGKGTATITATSIDGGYAAACVVNGPPGAAGQASLPAGAAAPKSGGQGPAAKPPAAESAGQRLAARNAAVLTAIAAVAAGESGNLPWRVYRMTAGGAVNAASRLLPKQQGVLNGYAGGALLILFLWGSVRKYAEYTMHGR